jgi:hypothetical protein
MRRDAKHIGIKFIPAPQPTTPADAPPLAPQ